LNDETISLESAPDWKNKISKKGETRADITFAAPAYCIFVKYCSIFHLIAAGKRIKGTHQ
jgi:hypothetical protein